ncbi:phage major tail tube protein, partial [Klebsiella aerogenes]|uniref:phage major tail tube protein n=1 Tax=Klebsiella aerogenes TaxID=548 RepID=UPI00387842CE
MTTSTATISPVSSRWYEPAKRSGTASAPGAAAIDLGLDDDALTVEWSVGGLPDVALFAQYAAPGADAVPLRFAGSYQRDDTGDIVA